MKPQRQTPTRARKPPTPKPAASPVTAAKKRRILIVDDHPMTRAGLAQFINRQPDLETCCEAGTPAEALTLLDHHTPDLILCDMTMPGRSGLEFIKDLLALNPARVILVVSMHDENIHAERALRAGARGYIMKEAGGEELLVAIRRVLSGQVYVSSTMSARILDALSGAKPRESHSPIQKLSDREFEVFQLIGHGKSTREIAKALGLSPKTVDVHRSHIKEKLNLHDATSLIRHAVRWVETMK